MKTITLSLAAAAIAAGSAAAAAELPTYEVNGLPISPVQVRLLGAAKIQEQSAAPAGLTSPHQISVLAPRQLRAATAAPVTTGLGH